MVIFLDVIRIDGNLSVVMNNDMIVLCQSHIKLDCIKQVHTMNETVQGILWCWMIHAIHFTQSMMVLEAHSSGKGHET